MAALASTGTRPFDASGTETSADVLNSEYPIKVTYRDNLETQARQQADLLLDYLVQRSETVDYRQGTYLLAALASELGGIVQRRCWDLAKDGDPSWEMAGGEAETLINAAWRCMATISALSDQEDRRHQDRRDRP